jgi:hypothetical protein
MVSHDTIVGVRKAVAARDMPVKSLISSVLDVLGEEPHLVRAILRRPIWLATPAHADAE